MNEIRKVRGWVFKGLCLVVLLLGAPAISQAATSNLGTLAVPSSNHAFGNTFDSTGLFTDNWDFRINPSGSDASLDAFIGSFNLFGFTAIVNFEAELWNSTTNTKLADSVLDDGGAALTLITFSAANLTAGDFFRIIVTGNVGTAPGTYDGSFTLSAVPLPGALVLFGTALFGLAGFRRRRKRPMSGAARQFQEDMAAA